MKKFLVTMSLVLGASVFANADWFDFELITTCTQSVAQQPTKLQWKFFSARLDQTKPVEGVVALKAVQGDESEEYAFKVLIQVNPNWDKVQITKGTSSFDIPKAGGKVPLPGGGELLCGRVKI